MVKNYLIICQCKIKSETLLSSGQDLNYQNAFDSATIIKQLRAKYVSFIRQLHCFFSIFLGQPQYAFDFSNLTLKYSLNVTSTAKLFFAVKQPLMCNKFFFLFEEKIMFCSRDIQIFVLGRSLLIPCSLSDERIFLFNANFSAYKLIIDQKFHIKQ